MPGIRDFNNQVKFAKMIEVTMVNKTIFIGFSGNIKLIAVGIEYFIQKPVQHFFFLK
jgi:hypothetical protein